MIISMDAEKVFFFSEKFLTSVYDKNSPESGDRVRLLNMK